MTARTALVLAAKLVLAGLLLWAVLSKVDAGSILDVLAGADLRLILLWNVLAPIAIALSAWRWKILAPGLALGTALKYTWIGIFFGNVLPGGISGDVAKGVSLAIRDANSRAGLAASILADKGLGFAALLAFLDAACVAAWLVDAGHSAQVRDLALVAFGLTILAASGAAALWFATRSGWLESRGRTGAIGPLVEGTASAMRWYADKPALLGRAFAISLALHALNVAAMYIGFRALHVEAGWLAALVIYPVLSILLVIPVSISGIGVRDATLAVFFALFGLPAASGVALSWLQLLTLVPHVLAGAAIQLSEMGRAPRSS